MSDRLARAVPGRPIPKSTFLQPNKRLLRAGVMCLGPRAVAPLRGQRVFGRKPTVSQVTIRDSAYVDYLSAKMIEAAVLFANNHPAVARALTQWIKGHCRVLEPITSLILLEPAVHLARPAVVVADLDFGGVSSLPVLMRLIRDVPDTYVVIYSGVETEVARDMSLAVGVRRFVSKMDECDVLMDAIKAGLPATHQLNTMAGRVLTRVVNHGRKGSHDHGPLIAWLIRSGYPQRMIAEAVGVSVKTVEYHSRQVRLRCGQIE